MLQSESLTRPIIGIEDRTAQEVFDIMCDRIAAWNRRPSTADRGGEVEVRALEWREEAIPPTGECLASTVVGLYSIPLGRSVFVLRFRDKDTLGKFPALEAAKAAAQADYTARIRSALATTTTE